MKCAGLFCRVAIQQIPNDNNILMPTSMYEKLPNEKGTEVIIKNADNRPTVKAEYMRLRMSFIFIVWALLIFSKMIAIYCFEQCYGRVNKG